MAGRPPLALGTYGEVTTRKTGKGRYQARAKFRDFDGVTRDVRRSGPTAEAARTALRDELTDRSAPSSDELSTNTPLNTAISLWSAEKFPRVSDGTRRRYREIIALHILPTLGALRIGECTTGRMDRFLKAVTEETGAPTAKHCKTVLSQVFAMVVRHDVLRYNPVDGVAGVTVTRSKVTRALTADQVQAARNAIIAWQLGAPIVEGRRGAGRPRSQDLHALFVVGVQTGARIGELLALRWQDVDMTAATVTIAGTLYRPDEDGAGWTRKDQTKTSSSRRTVDLPPTALSELMNLWASRTVANVHDAVFPSNNGTWRDPGNVRKTLRQILTPAGLGWITPHIFRSTAATHVNNELSLAEAAQQLGHSGTDTTARHYVEVTHRGPAVSEAMERLLTGGA